MHPRFVHARALFGAVACGALVLWSAFARAVEPEPLRPAGAELFEDFDPEAKVLRNISGVTCLTPGTCIAVADEMIAIQAFDVTVNDGAATYEAGRLLTGMFDGLCPDVGHRKSCDEVDLEGIARQGRRLLVTGSMGNKSKSGKKAGKRWFLAQFELDDAGKPVKGSRRIQSKRKLLRRLFNKHPRLDPFIERPLQCGGLNIEGLAQLGEQVFFGLRGPARRARGEAMIVAAHIGILDARKKEDVQPTRVFRLAFRDGDGKPIKDIGIRALEPIGDRLLIATGDTGVAAPTKLEHREALMRRCTDLVEGAAMLDMVGQTRMQPRIWIWDPSRTAEPVEVARIDGDLHAAKLEGLAVIGDHTPPVDLLLSFDGLEDDRVLSVLRDVAVPK